MAILATCYQILVEAFHLYYVSNAFNLMLANHLFDFIRVIGLVRANEINSLQCFFVHTAASNTRVRFAMRRLSNLQRLCFEYDVSPPQNALGESTQVVEGGYCAQKAFYRGKIYDDSWYANDR